MVGRVFLALHAVWEDEADDAANVEWFKRAIDAVVPLASGFYVAETDLLAGSERSARSFAEQPWRRIQELRAAVDPDGLFYGYPGIG
jgi:FAD/FMN-containing dehydrogenase